MLNKKPNAQNPILIFNVSNKLKFVYEYTYEAYEEEIDSGIAD